jgi:hypothetical protein
MNIKFASVVIAVSWLAGGMYAYGDENGPKLKRSPLISESALLSGLAAGALFPFIDTTPNVIVKAHVAITDSTESCAAGAAAPSNIQVLVGEAGVALVNVMTDSTNTGISSPAGQCVFHVTVAPGTEELPARITDIVILNSGASALTGIHTVTVSAEVADPKKQQEN